MLKNRLLLIFAAISLMAATAALSHPFPNASASTQPASSSMGSATFYEYRRGEWFPNAAVASSVGSAAFYEYRRGEWSPNATAVVAPVTGNSATVERIEAEPRLWSGEVFLSDNNQPDHMQNVQMPAGQNLAHGCFAEDSQPRPQSGCVE